jgi:hypothetical protein
MSFIQDFPVYLLDGRLVCCLHRLVVCPICCVDYNFISEDENSRDGPLPAILGEFRADLNTEHWISN